jgi:hypothetical protein
LQYDSIMAFFLLQHQTWASAIVAQGYKVVDKCARCDGTYVLSSRVILHFGMVNYHVSCIYLIFFENDKEVSLKMSIDHVVQSFAKVLTTYIGFIA